jgi:hypothetical protein
MCYGLDRKFRNYVHWYLVCASTPVHGSRCEQPSGTPSLPTRTCRTITLLGPPALFGKRHSSVNDFARFYLHPLYWYNYLSSALWHATLDHSNSSTHSFSPPRTTPYPMDSSTRTSSSSPITPQNTSYSRTPTSTYNPYQRMASRRAIACVTCAKAKTKCDKGVR